MSASTVTLCTYKHAAYMNDQFESFADVSWLRRLVSDLAAEAVTRSWNSGSNGISPGTALHRRGPPRPGCESGSRHASVMVQDTSSVHLRRLGASSRNLLPRLGRAAGGAGV